MFGLLRAALCSCSSLACVSNAKLYRPVSLSFPSAHDDECNKEIENCNQKSRKSSLNIKTRLLAR